ncbi:MAG: hypothetical protein FIA95_08970 [Gemmatimonadetes bacterium]|nr:hypothetical protein [Gemmatimonadota bacterium]
MFESRYAFDPTAHAKKSPRLEKDYDAVWGGFAKAGGGGEGNGGVILPSLHHTRDAPLAVALVLQHLLDEGGSLSQAARRWPAYQIVKEKRSFPRHSLPGAYDALVADLGAEEEDRTDGLRLAWPVRGCWRHVRPSGTEPVVRLIAEAPDTASARALVRRAGAILDGVA